jgi:GntR family transcriptional regulator/MocR family aminotransferase
MLPFQHLITLDKTHTTPLYLQIVNAFIAMIRQGIITPGSAMPSTRELAKVLYIHRKTVVAAYEELLAQSWIDVYTRKGFFVAHQIPEVRPRQIIEQMTSPVYTQKTHYPIAETLIPLSKIYARPVNQRGHLAFNDGFPDTRLAPVDLLIREYRRFAHYQFTPKYLLYGPEQGSENLRHELARFLSQTRGLHTHASNILITKGAQMAMYLTSQILLSQGDEVIVGEPGYFGANEVFEQAGARLNLVPVDKEGLDVDVVASICKTKKVRLLYVIPHHHHPTTVTLSPGRRRRLLELAVRYGFAILEDDYDFDFHYASSPILPLASIDYTGTVIYVGSFCKTIAPAIRVGFMVAPQNLIEQVTRLRRLVDRQGEQLLEEAMANLLKNGDITRHLKRVNKIYHQRRDYLCQLLRQNLAEQISFETPDGGFAVWITYAPNLHSQAVAEKAANLGLFINHAQLYYHNKMNNANSIRLGFSSLRPDEMEKAIAILCKAAK